jgi:hypothetical protein
MFMFEPRIIYTEFKKPVLDFEVKYGRASNSTKVNITAFQNQCKEAIKIDLICWTTIQKFDFNVLHHLKYYKFNLQFQTVAANF